MSRLLDVETPAGVMRGNGRLTRLYTNRFCPPSGSRKSDCGRLSANPGSPPVYLSEGTALDLGAGYWPWLVRLYLAFPPVQWLLGKQMLLVAERPG